MNIFSFGLAQKPDGNQDRKRDQQQGGGKPKNQWRGGRQWQSQRDDGQFSQEAPRSDRTQHPYYEQTQQRGGGQQQQRRGEGSHGGRQWERQRDEGQFAQGSAPKSEKTHDPYYEQTQQRGGGQQQQRRGESSHGGRQWERQRDEGQFTQGSASKSEKTHDPYYEQTQQRGGWGQQQQRRGESSHGGRQWERQRDEGQFAQGSAPKSEKTHDPYYEQTQQRGGGQQQQRRGEGSRSGRQWERQRDDGQYRQESAPKSERTQEPYYEQTQQRRGGGQQQQRRGESSHGGRQWERQRDEGQFTQGSAPKSERTQDPYHEQTQQRGGGQQQQRRREGSHGGREWERQSDEGQFAQGSVQKSERTQDPYYEQTQQRGGGGQQQQRRGEGSRGGRQWEHQRDDKQFAQGNAPKSDKTQDPYYEQTQQRGGGGQQQQQCREDSRGGRQWEQQRDEGQFTQGSAQKPDGNQDRKYEQKQQREEKQKQSLGKGIPGENQWKVKKDDGRPCEQGSGTSKKNVESIEKSFDELKIKDNLVSLKKKETITKGREGKPIRIYTNHIPLLLDKICSQAYHYDCVFDPDRPKRLLPVVIENARKKYFPNNYPAFDGKKNMYSAKKLELKNDQFSEIIEVLEENREKPTEYKLTIKLVNVINLTPLKNYMSNLKNLKNVENAMQCVDIVLRTASAVSLMSIGRNFFSPPKGQVIRLGDGLELWFGLFQSAFLGSKPFINVDIVNKGVTSDEFFTDVIANMARCDINIINNEIVSRKDRYLPYFNEFNKTFRNLKIVYQIGNLDSSKRKYRFNGFKENSPLVQTAEIDKKKITIYDYYLNTKKYKIKYPNLPLVWVGSLKSSVFVPLELCRLVSGQGILRKYTENQTREMIKYATTSTDVRQQKIMTNFQSANINNQKCVQEFGISVGNNFEEIDARVLDPPQLQYKKLTQRPSKGAWRAGEFYKACCHIDHWVIMSTVNPRFINRNDMARLADNLSGQSRKYGISMNVCKEIIELSRPNDRDIIRNFETLRKNDCQLVIVIIDDRDKSIYPTIKQIAEVTIGIVTQCLKSITVTRKLNDMTIGNIFLKINAKLNGINHKIEEKCRPKCLSVPCMIMGADVTHSAPDQRNEPSVAAVTASHDPEAFKYNITTRLQEPKVEIISDLEEITKQHLLYFYKQTQHKPLSIYFFRDGVSDGMFEKVLSVELNAIRRACNAVQTGYNPKITFLVVQKRHHTRFFPKDKRICEDRNFNLPAGTCVDSTIVSPDSFDFFLLSHGSIQGVSRPTRYRMLFDENNNTDDDIEKLTFYLCHLFSRCTRSVSYPAPTYYAHLAAFRAKHHLRTDNIDISRLEEMQDKYKISNNIQDFFPMFFV